MDVNGVEGKDMKRLLECTYVTTKISEMKLKNTSEDEIS